MRTRLSCKEHTSKYTYSDYLSVGRQRVLQQKRQLRVPVRDVLVTRTQCIDDVAKRTERAVDVLRFLQLLSLCRSRLHTKRLQRWAWRGKISKNSTPHFE